jgi:hypothetical protein
MYQRNYKYYLYLYKVSARCPSFQIQNIRELFRKWIFSFSGARFELLRDIDFPFIENISCCPTIQCCVVRGRPPKGSVQ